VLARGRGALLLANIGPVAEGGTRDVELSEVGPTVAW